MIIFDLRCAPGGHVFEAWFGSGEDYEAQKEMLKQSEHVGPRFADEARAIHLGEAEARAIHGQATPEQADELRDEGIPVSPLPFPLLPPESEN